VGTGTTVKDFVYTIYDFNNRLSIIIKAKKSPLTFTKVRLGDLFLIS
jgi:hypothetical protein